MIYRQEERPKDSSAVIAGTKVAIGNITATSAVIAGAVKGNGMLTGLL